MKMFGKVKRGPNGEVKEFKERACVRGDQCTESQRGDSSAAVPSTTTIHTQLADACVKGHKLVSCDIRAAFLSAPIDNDNIYVRIPAYYRKFQYRDGTVRPESSFKGGQGVELVGWARRSCYGLPQAMKLYNAEFKKTVLSAGLIQSDVDPCSYHKYTDRYEYHVGFRDSKNRPHVKIEYSTAPERDGVGGVLTSPYELHVVHWVDDILVSYTEGSPDYDELVSKLRARFELTGGEKANWILNQEILYEEEKGVLLLSQRAHVRQLAEKVLGVSKWDKPVNTVLPTNYEPSKLDSPTTEAGKAELSHMAKKYRAALGGALWIACQTRVDCQYAVSALGRKTSNPSKADWKALKHLIAYMSYTEDLCLRWCRDVTPGDDRLIMYCDSDFGGDRDTSRSTSGSVAMYHGGVLAHESKRQPLVAMSTMEAELISLTTTALTAVYLRALCRDFNMHLEGPTTIMEDNQSCIIVAEQEMISRRARHIPRRYFKVRELLSGDDPDIEIKYIKSAENCSDQLTKNNPPDTLLIHRNKMLASRAGIG